MQADVICYIYTLRSPEDHIVRYVGRSVCPRKRYYDHVARRRSARTSPVSQWIDGLRAAGLRPVMEIVDAVPVQASGLRETEWIERLSRAGTLLNSVLGRHGRMPGFEVSAETRRRISESKNGARMSDEARAQMSNAHKGQRPWNRGLSKVDDARMARMVANSAHTRTGMPSWSKGLTAASDERVKRSSDKRRGQKWTPERRAARRALAESRFIRGANGKFAGRS